MKVAIITGGSNGIGKGTAIELSKRGIGVIITYHSHPEAAEALLKELAPRRILVNAISPGPTHTNIGDGVFEKHPEYLEPLAKETALGRIGRPDDMAKVIAGLVSDDFGWVTAQDIEVSGGHIL